MCKTLHRLYDDWDASPDVRAILVKGAGGKAFCAGGDVKGMVQYILAGQHDKAIRLGSYTSLLDLLHQDALCCCQPGFNCVMIDGCERAWRIIRHATSQRNVACTDICTHSVLKWHGVQLLQGGVHAQPQARHPADTSYCADRRHCDGRRSGHLCSWSVPGGH